MTRIAGGSRRGRGRSTFSRRRQAAGLALAVACVSPWTLKAQVSAPAYHALQLDCGRFRQEFRSSITLESGGRRTRETTGRDGILVLRAASSDSGTVLTAWFDTLSVWRSGNGERIEPSTDGVIGGRFRGLLTSAGVFTSTDRPFVPDDVAQVANVGDALERLLPRLPAVPLERGESVKDGEGLVITRLADGTILGQVTERYRLTTRFEGEAVRQLDDSTQVTAHRTDTETGVFDWAPELGVVRWERQITIDVSVPAGGVVKQTFRTRIEQQALTARLEGSCSAP